MAEPLTLKGTLVGHENWVTSLAVTDLDANVLISGSRDRSLILWRLTGDAETYGNPERRMRGHSHFVSDVTVSSDGQYALSGSWDGTLRLWDLSTGETNRRFIGHAKDVLSVAFNADNTKIVSGSRDRSMKLWNVLGECKFTLNGHSDWVSCVRFCPSGDNELIVSCGWDKVVKVWDLSTLSVRTELAGHTGYLATVAVSPDGSLCASGGKDGSAMLWDLNEGRSLYKLDANAQIHALCFSPIRYWLCAATSKGIKIWDLETKETVTDLAVDFGELSKKALVPFCTSLCWSTDGGTLYGGFTDKKIRVWGVGHI